MESFGVTGRLVSHFLLMRFLCCSSKLPYYHFSEMKYTTGIQQLEEKLAYYDRRIGEIARDERYSEQVKKLGCFKKIARSFLLLAEFISVIQFFILHYLNLNFFLIRKNTANQTRTRSVFRTICVPVSAGISQRNRTIPTASTTARIMLSVFIVFKYLLWKYILKCFAW